MTVEDPGPQQEPEEESSFEQGQEQGFEGEQRVDNNEEQTLTGQSDLHLDSLAPQSGSAGDLIRVIGNGLSATNSVKLGDADAEFEAKGDGLLEVTVPEGSGTVDVVVATPDARTDLGDAFTYEDEDESAAS
jgi:hypothetical protein